MDANDTQRDLLGAQTDSSATATAGADTLTGGPAVDSLFGGQGADTLSANAGNDTITGGLDVDQVKTEAPKAPKPAATRAPKKAAPTTSAKPARGASSVRDKVAAKRDAEAAALEGDREERVHVVMQTSRWGGPDGMVGRHRVASAALSRAEALVKAGDARPATEAEVEAAIAGRGVAVLGD